MPSPENRFYRRSKHHDRDRPRYKLRQPSASFPDGECSEPRTSFRRTTAWCWPLKDRSPAASRYWSETVLSTAPAGLGLKEERPTVCSANP